MNAIKPFLKAIVPAIFGVLLTAIDMLNSGKFDLTHMRAAAVLLLTAIVVYFVPNTPTMPPVAPTAPLASGASSSVVPDTAGPGENTATRHQAPLA